MVAIFCMNPVKWNKLETFVERPCGCFSQFLRRSNRCFCSTQAWIPRNKRYLTGGRVHAPAGRDFVKGRTLQRQSAIWVRVRFVDIKTLGPAIWTKIGRVKLPFHYWKYRQLQNMTLIHWSFNRLVWVSGFSKGLRERRFSLLFFPFSPQKDLILRLLIGLYLAFTNFQKPSLSKRGQEQNHTSLSKWHVFFNNNIESLFHI